MSRFLRLLARALAVFRQRNDDGELNAEMDAHLAHLVDEHRRHGLSEEEARRRARLAFGGATQLREAHRGERGLPVFEEGLRDLRFALRGFRRQPGFTAIAIATLALGIGANAAVFSVVNAVLLQPLVYRDPDTLLLVARTPADTPQPRWISLSRWQAMRTARSFEVGVYRTAQEDALLGGAEPEVLRAGRMSSAVLGILGVRPIVGRGFLPADDADGVEATALISERLWTQRFGRDPAIVGRRITLGSAPHTVVGVLPGSFQFPIRDADVWMPRPERGAFIAPQYYACCSALMGIARLRSGFTRQQADAELAVLSAQYEPPDQRRVDAGRAILLPFKDALVARVSTMLWMLLAAVGLVLLIACANVATLLMARATARAREFAVRSAIGASRWRLLRQLVTESLALSIVGAVLGLAIASLGVRIVSRMTLFDLPRATEIEVSWVVLLWTMIIALGTAVLFGTFPSQMLRPALVERLRQGGSTESVARGRLASFGLGTRGTMVAAQVALSVILLIGAALMAETIVRLAGVDLGFQPAGLLTMRVPLPPATYDTPTKRSTFFDELVRRVNAIPEVRRATVVRALPTTGGLWTNLQIESQRIPDPGHVGQMLQTVVPGYFEVLGQSLKQGRLFEPRDNAAGAPPVAIVNESFARRFWPTGAHATPIGDRVMVPILPSPSLEIVGIVADVRHGGPQQSEANGQVYIPDRLYPPQVAFLALRTGGDPLRVVEDVRREVRGMDPNQSIADVNMMDGLIGRSLGQRHVAARVLGLFAATAVVLAMIGLYGVMTYSVAQQAQEIGVRRALGAGHRDVLRGVLGHALRVALTGIAFGVAGAAASTRWLESLLFGVQPMDAATFAAVSAAFVLIALLASLVPAWRAMRIDPARTLRAG